MLELTTGDTTPELEITLQLDGTGADLTDATDYVMHWLLPDGTTREVTLEAGVDITAGQLKYVWQDGDTDIAGVHRAQVVVTWPEGQQTFPNDGTHYLWQVYPAIDV